MRLSTLQAALGLGNPQFHVPNASIPHIQFCSTFLRYSAPPEDPGASPHP